MKNPLTLGRACENLYKGGGLPPPYPPPPWALGLRNLEHVGLKGAYPRKGRFKAQKSCPREIQAHFGFIFPHLKFG